MIRKLLVFRCSLGELKLIIGYSKMPFRKKLLHIETSQMICFSLLFIWYEVFLKDISEQTIIRLI